MLKSLPKRKLSIFIGSTKEDLNDVRNKIIYTLLHSGHIPSGMELWAADHIPTLDAIEKHLGICDLHIIILGARYGSKVQGGLSFTEWEFKKSQDAGRPVIAFLLDKKEFESHFSSRVSKKIGTNRKKRKTDSEKEKEALMKFRGELQDKSICKFFVTQQASKKSEKETHSDAINIDSISSHLINSINEVINDGNIPKDAGWIRARSEHGERLSAIERNPFLLKILDKVRGFSKLTDRHEKESEAKDIMAGFFWETMFGRIKRHSYYQLFFESGSTLNFLSDKFREKLKTSAGEHQIEKARWKITTNNAVTLLDLLLDSHLDVAPRPAGAPEEKYGAMFDDVLLENPEPPPQSPRHLFETEKKAVKETAGSLQSDKKKRLYLMTASGLDLDECTEPGFQGPHVGSHPNMLFKRAIFRTKEPIVFFLDASKLEKKFIVGECYPIFDPTEIWQEAFRKASLSVCIGYEEKIRGRIKRTEINKVNSDIQKKIKKFLPEFTLYASFQSPTGGCLIFSNKNFLKIFPKE